MKKLAIILSGCGVYDGAEIHEATLSLYFAAKYGFEYDIFAPDIEQLHVINHLTGEETNETRNVLVEAARIARGNIKSTISFDAEDYDALLLPGGFGVAKNLSDYAMTGDAMSVLPEIKEMLVAMYEQGKPIGALCISPVLLAATFQGIEVSIGQDANTAADIEKMGALHRATKHGEVVHDQRYNMFTTPCYMLDANIVQIGQGVENIIKALEEELEV